MPGPVDSPSLSAIEAVINPSSTKYMYFVADVTTGMSILLKAMKSISITLKLTLTAN